VRHLVPFCAALTAALAAAPAASGGTRPVDLARDALFAVAGTQPGEEFGYAIASGDVDGDGLLEIVVGAPGRDDALGRHRAGAVYVFDADDLLALNGPGADTSACAVTIEGPGEQSRFGASLLVLDADGDGIDDILVGAPGWAERGQVAVGCLSFFGGPVGERGATLTSGDARAVVGGDANGDRFGSALSASDIDRDGRPEVLVAAFRAGAELDPSTGEVFVIDAETLARGGVTTASDVARAMVRGERRGDALGAVAAGDLDGDGETDLALGAFFADGNEPSAIDVGRVYLAYGGLPPDAIPGAAVSVAGMPTILGPVPRGLLGRSLAVGDIDDDGIDDLVVSAYTSRGKREKEDAAGEAFVVFGGKTRIPRLLDLGSATVPRMASQGRWDLFGLPVLVADLTGDGSADIVISAQFADSPDGGRREAGCVYVYWGGLKSVIDAKSGSPDLADVTIFGETDMDTAGGAIAPIALTGTSGSDLLVGAPRAGRADTGEGEGRLYLVPAASLGR
jgi:hypothetical protein